MQQITLRAGTAFGDGAHESTRLALAAIELLAEGRPSKARILDLGCGSGILSLAAAQFWPEATIVACDIAEAAVHSAVENVALNGLSNTIQVLRSDGFIHQKIKESSPYSLIIANILAQTLIMQAGMLEKHLAPGGSAVLSGILAWLLPSVLEAYGAAGLKSTHALSQGDWRAIIVRKD